MVLDNTYSIGRVRKLTSRLAATVGVTARKLGSMNFLIKYSGEFLSPAGKLSTSAVVDIGGGIEVVARPSEERVLLLPLLPLLLVVLLRLVVRIVFVLLDGVTTIGCTVRAPLRSFVVPVSDESYNDVDEANISACRS